jgi:hypothetical protein
MAIHRQAIRKPEQSWAWWCWVWVAVGVLSGNVLACAPGSIADEGKLPPNVQDPATLHTPAGAVARYRGALDSLPATFERFMTESAILTDELAALPTHLGTVGTYSGLDSRTDLSSAGSDYGNLHRLRAQAREARGFLSAYAPDSSPALAGHLYAVEGYADVFLADLFCSGILLSTVDFTGGYTLVPGSTTTEVYNSAVALFDSALTLVSDSVRFQHLAAGTGIVGIGALRRCRGGSSRGAR